MDSSPSGGTLSRFKKPNHKTLSFELSRFETVSFTLPKGTYINVARAHLIEGSKNGVRRIAVACGIGLPDVCRVACFSTLSRFHDDLDARPSRFGLFIMAVPAAIAIVPIGILFILSGLIVNCIQAVVYILVRPLCKNLYRRMNKVVAELLWLELIWLFDWWAGAKIEVYADEQTFELMGKEHALFIANHRSDVDWLVGWVLAQRSGCLGSALAVMKKSSKILPIIGWSMWFSDYVFLEKSWAKDENTLEEAFKKLEDFPRPFWLALFVEGTRFTQTKLLAAQQYATSSGLPIPRNVLIPRTKGFVSAVKHLRLFVPAIYDTTVAVSKTQRPPTMLRMLKGQSSVIKVHIKRHSIEELPDTSNGISQWCKDMFISKDAFLENYFKTDRFNDHDYQDIGRPVQSLLVVIAWSCLLMLGIYGFLEWSSLPTWETLMFCAAFLIVVAIIMQMLIMFTESERSNPQNLLQTTTDPAVESLLQK